MRDWGKFFFFFGAVFFFFLVKDHRNDKMCWWERFSRDGKMSDRRQREARRWSQVCMDAIGKRLQCPREAGALSWGHWQLLDHTGREGRNMGKGVGMAVGWVWLVEPFLIASRQSSRGMNGVETGGTYQAHKGPLRLLSSGSTLLPLMWLTQKTSNKFPSSFFSFIINNHSSLLLLTTKDQIFLEAYGYPICLTLIK